MFISVKIYYYCYSNYPLFASLNFSGCSGVETKDNEDAEWKMKLKNKNCKLLTVPPEEKHSQV